MTRINKKRKKVIPSSVSKDKREQINIRLRVLLEPERSLWQAMGLERRKPNYKNSKEKRMSCSRPESPDVWVLHHQRMEWLFGFYEDRPYNNTMRKSLPFQFTFSPSNYTVTGCVTLNMLLYFSVAISLL